MITYEDTDHTDPSLPIFHVHVTCSGHEARTPLNETFGGGEEPADGAWRFTLNAWSAEQALNFMLGDVSKLSKKYPETWFRLEARSSTYLSGTAVAFISDGDVRDYYRDRHNPSTTLSRVAQKKEKDQREKLTQSEIPLAEGKRRGAFTVIEGGRWEKPQ